ncbi:dTDP-4-dehydrorhamnose reductase [Paenimyroides ceti]
MKKILITGENGQLGSEMKNLSDQYKNYEWIFANRSTLDFLQPDTIADFLNSINPDIIVNTVAYTAVDKAEHEKDEAMLVNCVSVKEIAKWAKRNDCRFIHISTDYVFDGTHEIPLKETDETHPINVYGETKYLGEQAIIEAGCSSVIIRTSWVYSVYGQNFVKTMLRLMAEKQAIQVVDDQIGGPTYAKDLAEVIMAVIQHRNWKPGIYHFSNKGNISWYEFATVIKVMSGFKCRIDPVPSSSYPTIAKRPHFSLLNSSKISETFGIEIKDWKYSLQKMLANINKK